MVPTTPLQRTPTPDTPQPTHENINDLPAHRLTDPQIFYPVSESRHFTRTDAGRVFSAAPALKHSEVAAANADPAEHTLKVTSNPSRIETVGRPSDHEQVLQPAETRIPHPHLVSYHRDRNNIPNERTVWNARYRERVEREEKTKAARRARAQKKEEDRTQKVQPDSSRFEFRFTDVVFDKQTTGSDGRGTKAPGRRYGVPNYDRVKGGVKIPTKVET